MLTIQQLIDHLNTFEDKRRPVYVYDHQVGNYLAVDYVNLYDSEAQHGIQNQLSLSIRDNLYTTHSDGRFFPELVSEGDVYEAVVQYHGEHEKILMNVAIGSSDIAGKTFNDEEIGYYFTSVHELAWAMNPADTNGIPFTILQIEQP